MLTEALDRPTFTISALLETASLGVSLGEIDCASTLRADLCEPDVYRLDLSLDPRPRGVWMRYTDHWPLHRMEEPGCLFLLPPGEHVHINSGVGRQRAVICRLRADAVQTWLGHDLQLNSQTIDASLNVTAPIIRQLLLRMAAEARAPGIASDILIEAMGVQVAVELERFHTAATIRSEIGGLADWRLKLIEARLRDDLRPPTLTDLGVLCHLSVRQLARGFRESMGIAIGQYIRQVRIDHAKRLLEGGMSVKGAAFSIGFASPSAFTLAFRLAVGVTPKNYGSTTGAR